MRTAAERPSLDVIRLARITVPLHLLMPPALWALARLDLGAAGYALLSVHLAFPLVLAVTWRMWRDRIPEMVGLIAIDHVATLMGAMLWAEVAAML